MRLSVNSIPPSLCLFCISFFLFFFFFSLSLFPCLKVLKKFCDSVYLLYAWLQVLHQGKNAVLELQVSTCRLHWEANRHTLSKKGSGSPFSVFAICLYLSRVCTEGHPFFFFFFFEDARLLEFIYLVFTRTPVGLTIGNSCLCCCVPCLSSAIISLCWFYTGALGLILFQITTILCEANM